MNKPAKKIVSLFLAACMATSLFPTALAFGESGSTEEDKIVISANSDNTILVNQGTQPGPIADESLELSSLNFVIQRDYEQSCMITVTNTSNEAREFYLDAVNSYGDLSMEIIKNGSKGSPAIIAANESMEVELSVFAQNAEQEQYTIPVTAYVLSGNEYVENAKGSVSLTCNLPNLNLDWTLLSSDQSTLKAKYCVSNNGGTLTDLTITASDSIKDYLSFSPVITNFELPANEQIEFEVWPDLAKMKNNDVGRLSGSLIASCAGKTAEHECVFDTNGGEITVTTMGQLALRQDGNPFSKFEILDSSATAHFVNGNQSVAFSDDTTIDDLLDADDQFNLLSHVDVDLGVETECGFDLSAKSTKVAVDEITPDNLSAKFEEIDGSICVTTYKLLTAAEYQDLLDTALAEGAEASQIAVLSSNDESLTDNACFLIENTFMANDILDLVDYGSDSLGIVGNLWDTYCLYEDFNKSYDVAFDPRYSTEQKVEYLGASLMKTVLTGGKAAVSLVCPGVGVLFSLMTTPLDMLLDSYQDAILSEADKAAIYSSVYGHQCTNRGRVTVPFYVPNYDRTGKSKPSIHTTSRMYGDGYVDKTDTNFDIKLNDEPAGTTKNTGLTDVVMTEIPADNLKPGEENTVEFDYDTNPGSHSVVTDTEITLLYPDDTEVGYIGQPDNLEDVRTKPDFCVYPENIYTSDDLIVGEPSKLKFNVYNRGSHGGWFNVVCTENSREIFTQQNYYLAAFKSQTFEIDWTPSAEDSTIRVELTNTSVDLNERNHGNNSVEKTVTARQREVPEIQMTGNDIILEDKPFSVILDVSNYLDVKSAEFTLDKTVPTEVRSSDSEGHRRYWLYFGGLPSGSYSLNANITYQASDGEKAISKAFNLNTQRIVPSAHIYSTTFMHGEKMEFSVANIKNLTRTEVSIGGGSSFVVMPDATYPDGYDYSVDLTSYSAGSLNVLISMYYQNGDGTEAKREYSKTITSISEDDSYFSFSLAENITSPNISAYEILDDSGYAADIICEFEQTGTYSYRCLKTVDMVLDPAKFMLVVSYDSGVIVTNMAESGKTISDAECSKLIINRPDDSTLSSVVVIEASNAGNCYYLNTPVSTDAPIMLTPGTYTILLEGTVKGISFSSSVEVDLTNGDLMIDLSDCILSYQFEMVDPSSSEYSAILYYRDNGNDYWSESWLDTLFDSTTGILQCFSADLQARKQLAECCEACIVISSDTELYFVQLKQPDRDMPLLMPVEAGLGEDPIKLSKSDLNKVTLVCNSSGWLITDVDVQWNGLAAHLYGDTLYIPDGDYSFYANLSSENRTLTSITTATVTSNCEVEVGQGLSAFRDVTITWPKPFDQTAFVRRVTDSGDFVSNYDFVSGDAFKSQDGPGVFDFTLTHFGNTFGINRDFEVSEQNHQLTVGNRFNGKVYLYGDSMHVTGDAVYAGMSDVVDEYGNKLSYFDASTTPLFGTATFTDVSDESKTYSVPITTSSLDGLKIGLPGVSGTYSLSVELTTNRGGALHTVTFDSQGGSEIESASVPHGDKVSSPIDPNYDSFTFGGWYKEPACLNAWDFASDVVSGDITLYAKWIPTADAVTVDFDSQGGSYVASCIVARGDIVSRPNDPTRPDYTFVNWYKDADFIQIYNFDAPVTSNITLYAKWEPRDVVGSVTSVVLDKSKASLVGAESTQLVATVLPDDVTNQTVLWKTSDSQIARVDDNGLVTAVGKGTAIITATSASDSSKYATCTVTVSNPATSIGLNPIKLDLTKGRTSTIKTVLSGALSGAVDDVSVTWSSSDAKVATVDGSGVVTAVANGAATITAAAGNLRATCTVTVTNPVTSIKLSENSKQATVGDAAFKLTATVVPADADDGVLWASSNATVAKVSSDGTVEILGAGKADITASIGAASATCSLSVDAKKVASTPVDSNYGADLEITDSASANNFASITFDKGDMRLVVQSLTNIGDAVKSAINALLASGLKVAETFDVSLHGKDGVISIDADDGVSMNVRIKMTDAIKALDPATLKVVYVADDGKTEDKAAWVEDDNICFTTNHFSTYVVTGKDPQPESSAGGGNATGGGNTSGGGSVSGGGNTAGGADADDSMQEADSKTDTEADSNKNLIGDGLAQKADPNRSLVGDGLAKTSDQIPVVMVILVVIAMAALTCAVCIAVRTRHSKK